MPPRAKQSRRGAGSVRPGMWCCICCGYSVQNGEIEVVKVGTKHNMADLYTKHHTAPRIAHLMRNMGVEL
eukprot:10761116-Heterocapsa_arctica.AAC.1